jgi:hypothetical protein
MAEQIVKLFGKEIQENLFPENMFYKQSKLDGGIDVKARTVQVPQAGSTPTIQVDPSSFPLTISQRTDDVLEYDVKLYATEPIHIEDVNEIVTNYNKRADIIKDHAKALNTRIADEIAYGWAPTAASQKIFTTGTATGNALAPGATGTRNAITRDDMASLAIRFDKDDVATDERNILVDASLYLQLLQIDSFINFDYVSNKPVNSGQVGEIFGMKVFKRSQSVYFDASNVKKTIGAATAATDNLAILAWADSYVRRGEGNVKVYSDFDKPEYLGSIFNAAVRAGGSFGRNDEKGVYALIQQ